MVVSLVFISLHPWRFKMVQNNLKKYNIYYMSPGVFLRGADPFDPICAPPFRKTAWEAVSIVPCTSSINNESLLLFESVSYVIVALFVPELSPQLNTVPVVNDWSAFNEISLNNCMVVDVVVD